MLFEYNGVREISAPIRQTLHHGDRDDQQEMAQMLTAKQPYFVVLPLHSEM